MSVGPEQVDLLEGGLAPPWWRRAWSALSPRGRRVLVALVVLAVAGAGVVVLRERAADQARREQVVLAATLGIASSSTDPPGGQVRFFLVVLNTGPLAVSVTTVEGGGEGLRLRPRDSGDRPVEPGSEIEIPLSVGLTCPTGPGVLSAVIGVRRDDGVATSRRVDLQAARLLLDVAATVCAVRPDLRDHELSGPALRQPATSDGER